MVSTARTNWVVMTPSRLLDSGAVAAGVFTDNLPTFVARVWHENNILPGIARPNVGAWASWQDHEVKKEHFEVSNYGTVDNLDSKWDSERTLNARKNFLAHVCVVLQRSQRQCVIVGLAERQQNPSPD